MRALDQLATAVEMRLAKFFRRVGYFVADRPYSCIIGSILLAAVLSAGAVTIKSESRARELYAPSGNRGQKDLDLASGLFAAVEPEERHNSIIAYTEDGRDLYTREVLNSLYALITDLKKVTAEHNDETFSFQDVCPKSVQKGFENQCQFIGVTSLMSGPISNDSQKPVLAPFVVTDLRGLVEVVPLFAGGRQVSADGSTVEKVAAWKFDFDMVSGEGIRDARSEALANALFDFLEERTKDQTNADPYLLAYDFWFSEGDELDKSTSGDIDLLLITFVLVIAFSFLAVRSYSDFVLSKGNVVWGAQLGVVLAIGSAFGLMGFCGVKFNPVVSTTAFLLLGLGVDDAYVLIQAYHTAGMRLGPEATVRDRMGTTFETAGVSILFTSLTDIMAFAVGASSVFPAVVGFCAYTATGVAFDFLFQCSLFGAVLAIDAHREYCGVKEWRALWGEGWLFKEPYNSSKNLIKENGEGPPGGKIPIMPEVEMVSRIMKRYGQVLMQPVSIACVLLIYAGYAAFAVIGTTKVGTGLDIRDLAPSDSYWTVFVNQDVKYFREQGPAFELVFPPGSIDWTAAEERAKAVELLEKMEGLDCVFPEPGGAWLREMSRNTSIDVANLEGDAFLSALGDFLAGPGYEFRQNVLVDTGGVASSTPQGILASKMTLRIEPLRTTSGDDVGVPCIKANRNAIDEWVEKHSYKDRPAPVISNGSFPFWDGSAVIVEQTARNLLYAAMCCFIMTLLILPHPVLCFAAMAVVASILAGVVASMALLLDIRIETISMIDLVLAIGFSIDNVAHYCHAYMISRAPTRREKSIAALQLIGIPILLGDASTMVALLPLLASKSRIFQSFFYILFTVLLLGAIHAVVLLPVVLGLIGPLPEYLDSKPEEEDPPNPLQINEIKNPSPAEKMEIGETAEREASTGQTQVTRASQHDLPVLVPSENLAIQPGMMQAGMGGMVYPGIMQPGMMQPGMLHPAGVMYGYSSCSPRSLRFNG